MEGVLKPIKRQLNCQNEIYFIPTQSVLINLNLKQTLFFSQVRKKGVTPRVKVV